MPFPVRMLFNWHPWLVLGVLLDLAVLGALVWQRWAGTDLIAR